MPLFEFEAGRLVPAQAGHPLSEPVEPAVLEAVRGQLLELVGDPLFPIAWQESHGATWLTAMAADGQAVALEVVDRLDATVLVAALARLGRTRQTSWAELADLYPRGTGAFRRDWNAFREGQPPHHPKVARQHVVAARIDDDVRPAVAALAEAGIVVHELAARVMSSGRLFLDVTEVTPGPARLPWLEPGRRAGAVETTPATIGRLTPRPSAVGVRGPASTQSTEPTEPASTQAKEPASTRPSEPMRDLRAIGESLGSPAPLVWQDRGARHEATLTPDGWIEFDDDRFGDPQLAAVAVGAARDTDAWSGWRFGADGPSLYEARNELLAHHERRRRGSSRGPAVRSRARRRREAID